jgi:hypothetical protein
MTQKSEPRSGPPVVSDEDEASFADLASFSTKPPPPGDVHNACTTVTELPYKLLESLKNAPLNEALAREADASAEDAVVEIVSSSPDDEELLASLEAMYEGDERGESATVIVEAEPATIDGEADLESRLIAALAAAPTLATHASVLPADETGEAHAAPTARETPTLPPRAAELALLVRPLQARWAARLPRPIVLAGFVLAAVTAASASAGLMWTLVRLLYHQ